MGFIDDLDKLNRSFNPVERFVAGPLREAIQDRLHQEGIEKGMEKGSKAAANAELVASLQEAEAQSARENASAEAAIGAGKSQGLKKLEGSDFNKLTALYEKGDVEAYNKARGDKFPDQYGSPENAKKVRAMDENIYAKAAQISVHKHFENAEAKLNMAKGPKVPADTKERLINQARAELDLGRSELSDNQEMLSNHGIEFDRQAVDALGQEIEKASANPTALADPTPAPLPVNIRRAFPGRTRA